jgi:iron(III) transport system substrate-binding protein
VIKALDDGLQAALTGAKSPARAMKDAQEEAERILQPYRRLKNLASFLCLVLMLAPAAVHARAAIEDELVVQTPMSAFVVDSMLKEFAQYAMEKWAITLKTRVLRAGTPVSHETIQNWKGQPEADIFWGGESALFDDLAAKKLLTKLEVPPDVWEAIPPSIGTPRPIPLKDPARFWVGTALEVYGLVYSPRLLKRLGVPAPREWDDILTPKLKGHIVQCMPTRSSSSHATYQMILQAKGESGGWEWLKRLAAYTRVFLASSREVPAVVARTESAVGFAVPSYFAFEEKLAGFDIRFVAPKNAFVTPEPFAILAGAKHPHAALQFLHFLLSERGQRLFMGRGLFPVTPKYKVHGPPGSTEELAVQLTGASAPSSTHPCRTSMTTRWPGAAIARSTTSFGVISRPHGTC